MESPFRFTIDKSGAIFGYSRRVCYRILGLTLSPFAPRKGVTNTSFRGARGDNSDSLETERPTRLLRLQLFDPNIFGINPIAVS